MLGEYSPSSLFNKMFLILDLFLVPWWLDLDLHSQLQFCTGDVISFSGYHVWRSLTSICLPPVMTVLISQSRCCSVSPLYNYWFLLSLETNRQPVRKHFKVIQISWFSLKKFSLYLVSINDFCLLATKWLSNASTHSTFINHPSLFIYLWHGLTNNYCFSLV